MPYPEISAVLLRFRKYAIAALFVPLAMVNWFVAVVNVISLLDKIVVTLTLPPLAAPSSAIYLTAAAAPLIISIPL